MDFRRQKEVTSPGRYLWGILQSIPFLLLVGVPLFLCNFLQILALIFLLPFSRHAFRWANYYIAAFWWALLVLWVRHVLKLRIIRSGDILPYEKSAILIGNHVEQTDIPVLLDLAFNSGCLGGLKFFAKDPLKWVPGIGWGMLMLDYLLVKRSWDKDAEYVERLFRRLADYRSPIWLMSFPEGTRIKPHKLKRTQKLARTNKYPLLNNVLLPRTRGFIATVEHMRDWVDGVYDITLAYPHGIPTLGQFIRGTVPAVHVHIRRFPIAELPRGRKELEAWLLNRFVEKDKLLENFFEKKSFGK